MSAPQFDIVFRGVRHGFDPALVKGQFANLFKLDVSKVERVFKSKNVTLKNNADERLANIFVARLLAIGVLADKLPVENIPSKAFYTPDCGEVSTDSSSMHQPIEFVYGEYVRRIPFMFSGTGAEYCKIWLVNVLVCLLSAGILYPWAKIRSLRYFYGHTHLDDVEFSYTSNPQKIFLVQFALVLYVAALCYAFFIAPWLGGCGALALIVMLPFYWSKRSAFQLQHSYYGDVSFQKKYDLRKAYTIFLLFPLLALITAGLAAPFAIFKIQQYRTETTAIDGVDFMFSARSKLYLSLLPPLLVAEILSVGGVYFREYLPFSFLILLLAGTWILVFVRWRVAVVNLQWNATSTKLGYFVSTWDLPSYNKLATKNILLCLMTFGFYWPWARVSIARYKAQHLALFANQRFKKWQRKLNNEQNKY